MFKSLLRIIAIVLMVIAIVFAFVAVLAYMGAVSLTSGFVASAFAAIGITGLSVGALATFALGAFVLAVLIDKDAALGVFGKAVGAVGDALSTVIKKGGEVIGSIGDAAGSAISPFLKSVGGWVIGGLGLYLGYKYVTKDDTPSSPQNTRSTAGSIEGERYAPVS